VIITQQGVRVASQQFERGRIPADMTHDCIIDINDRRRQYRVWNPNGDRFAEGSAVEHHGLAAADHHRVILVERDFAAARSNGDTTRLIHQQRKIVVAVCDHLACSHDSGGGKPARHQLQSRQGT
jgi:hypothetical protein